LNGKTGLEGPGSSFIENLDTLQTDPYREEVYNQVYKNSEKNQLKIAVSTIEDVKVRRTTAARLAACR
jgi:hypothetical protein